MNIYEAENLLQEEKKKLDDVNQNGWKYPDKKIQVPKVVQTLVRLITIWTK